MNNFIIRGGSEFTDYDYCTIKESYHKVLGVIGIYRYVEEEPTEGGICVTDEYFIDVFNKIVRKVKKESVR